jgi:lysophospholipase L1-like esterase
LTDIGDTTHFDAPSLRELGRRYAAAYLKLNGNLATTEPSTTSVAVPAKAPFDTEAQNPKQAAKVRGTITVAAAPQLTIKDDGGEHVVVAGPKTQFRRVEPKSLAFIATTIDQARVGEFASVSFDAGQSTPRNVWLAADEAQMSAAWRKQIATAGTPKPATAPAVTEQSGDEADLTWGRVKTGRAASQFMSWHEKYVARAKEGNVDVVFLGDSITAGWRKAPELWNQRYEPLKAVNFGVGGDGIQHVLWRVENGEFDGVSPKVVVLLIGTNNAGRGPARVAEGIEHLVGVIRAKSPATKVLLLAIFPREREGEAKQVATIKEVNARIAKLDDRKSVRFLDIGRKFLDADGKFRKDLFSDGLHPNPAGYQVWADAMQPLLDEMLKQ